MSHNVNPSSIIFSRDVDLVPIKNTQDHDFPCCTTTTKCQFIGWFLDVNKQWILADIIALPPQNDKPQLAVVGKQPIRRTVI